MSLMNSRRLMGSAPWPRIRENLVRSLSDSYGLDCSKKGALMSAMGQKQTWQRILLMSALPPKADMDQHGCPLCANSRKRRDHSITSSARAESPGGTFTPSFLAVLR